MPGKWARLASLSFAFRKVARLKMGEMLFSLVSAENSNHNISSRGRECGISVELTPSQHA